jgi:hypothetical protein
MDLQLKRKQKKSNVHQLNNEARITISNLERGGGWVRQREHNLILHTKF